MRANRARARILLPLAVFVIVLVWLFSGSRIDGDFRIDEAHKIADTAFLGHLLRGDLRHPDWFRHIVDRTNPPVGKYLFGLSALLHGLHLPDSVSIRTELDSGRLGQRLRPEVETQFTPHLLAVRRVAAVSTALTAALLCLIALRLQGFIGALLTPALYLSQFLTLTFAATAVYDPVLTLFVTATAVPLMFAWLGSDSWFGAAAAGVLAALALQTRLSGAVALLMILVVYCIVAVRRKSLRPAIKGAAAAVICLIVAGAANPFYWRGPRQFAVQWSDAQILLAREHDMQFRGVEKLRFISEILAGDLAGFILMMGALVAILMMHPRGTPLRQQLWFLLLWSGGTTTMLLFWLPLAWPRYLLPMIPALALLAGFGWAELAHQIVQAGRRDARRAT